MKYTLIVGAVLLYANLALSAYLIYRMMRAAKSSAARVALGFTVGLAILGAIQIYAGIKEQPTVLVATLAVLLYVNLIISLGIIVALLRNRNPSASARLLIIGIVVVVLLVLAHIIAAIFTIKILGLLVLAALVNVVLFSQIYAIYFLRAAQPRGAPLYLRIAVACTVMFFVMEALAGTKAAQINSQIQKFSNMKQETVVSDAPAQQETWKPYFTSVGNLTPVQGVDVSNQLAGNVTGIHFQSGTQVKKGQLLVQLDDSSQRAQLVGLQAQVQLAQLNYARARELIKQHLISTSDLDTAENNLKQAQSNLQNDLSAIDKLAIRAPFSGQIGIRTVNLGQYLPVGTSIAGLQSLDTLYVQFGLPEQDLAPLARGQHVEVTVDAYPGKVFNGELNAINSAVDPNTHNIGVQAIIHNAGHLLRAGMFANVRVYAGAPQSVVTVPTSAVDYSLYGSSVFLVKQEGKGTDGKPVLKVTQQFVTTGQERDGRVAITQGLKAGDVIVTSGQQKLQNGMQVEINNSVKLD